ncbi:hypothetical protein [Blautia hydrogenotrophica]|uniref:hypothetical protein n=1 Tax=Blautia hydrogenotrophica TaxID=53443 RepID=UPI003AB5B851
MFKGQIVDDAGDSDWNLTFSLIVLELEVHIPFITVIALTSLLAIRMEQTWEELETKILNSIVSVFQAVIILFMVGMVIGAWIQGKMAQGWNSFM